MLISGVGLLAFRDPYGIRPLCYGTNGNKSYAFASESCAIDPLLGFHLVRDVNPGEAILVTLPGNIYQQQCHSSPVLCPCIFEYVYFARPDTVSYI
jgi:amidophosphoribosyltransferase